MLGLGLGLNKLRSSGLSSFLSGAMVWSLNYINKWGETSVELWGLSIKIAQIFTAYVARVTAGGGVVEGEACLGTKLTNLDTIELLDNASLVTIPSGYKSGVVYSEVPTSGAGDLAFTRASTATRINSSGLIESVATGVPRLTYPIGGGCPSLLFEAQRTNLVTYSNDFSNAAWTKSGTIVTPNYAISPDGTQNASRLQLPFPNTQLFQAVGVQGSSTSSIYIKGTAGQTIALYNSFLGAGTYELRTLNGEWQRITVSSVGTILSYFAISNFLSATATDVLIYGSQLELGSYPTSYIPTTTATVTRVVDTALTTSNFGSDYTLFVDFNNNTVGGVNRYIGDFQSSNGGQGTFLIGTNNKFRYIILYNGTYIAGQNLTVPTTYTVGDRIKGAIVKSGSSYKFFSNGSLIASYTYTAPTTEIINKSYFAQSFVNDNSLNLNQFIGYVPLTDSQAIALTTL